NTVFNLFGAEYDDQGNLVAPGELSLFPRFTEAGFGYFITPDGNAFGLPLGTGTLILGSPFVRDNSSEAAYFQSQLPQIAIQDNFSRTDQGVHVIDGSIGSVLVHGVAHGFSFVEGAAARYNVGFQPGSLSVESDLGAFYIASDAARLVNPQNSVVSTGGVLSVGRTLGQVAIGGASFMDVTVVGDINNPNRPVVDYLTYNELEVVYGIDP